MAKKIMTVFLFLSFCAPVWLLARNKVWSNWPRKRKPARKLKGKEIKVITNEDLQKLTKTPAIIITE